MRGRKALDPEGYSVQVASLLPRKLFERLETLAWAHRKDEKTVPNTSATLRALLQLFFSEFSDEEAAAALGCQKPRATAKDPSSKNTPTVLEGRSSRPLGKN